MGGLTAEGVDAIAARSHDLNDCVRQHYLQTMDSIYCNYHPAVFLPPPLLLRSTNMFVGVLDTTSLLVIPFALER